MFHVKHKLESLRDYFAALGFDLSESQLGLFDVYCSLVVEWSSRISFTAIKDAQGIYVKHFVDSLAAVPFLRSANARVVLDVGAGGGFPGVPLAVVLPGVSLLSVDSVAKKTAFVQLVADRLSLGNVSVLTGRAEEPVLVDRLRPVDVVLGRAVFYLPIFLEVAAPYLQSGGRVIAYKSRARLAEELVDAERVLGLCNLELENKIDYEIEGDPRVLLVYRKKSNKLVYSRPIHRLKKIYDKG